MNSYEVEGRRISRFFSFGHTPGGLDTLPEKRVNPEFPPTLDLRKKGRQTNGKQPNTPPPVGNDPVLTAGTTTAVNDPIFTDIPSVFDLCTDMLASDGKIASHWEGLIEYMNTLGRKELERRWQKARQIMHEHGVAYNIFSGQKKMERPWELDPIPFPISMETWDFLERGIRQRTRLLTAILTDIYGPQTLIRNYHLPPELFFANPRFLRQCNGLYTGVALKLHFHATDLCRFPDN